MTTLTLAKLAEIEAAAAKATPGPWKWQGEDYRGGWGWQILVTGDGRGILCGEDAGKPYAQLRAYIPIDPKHCKTGMYATPDSAPGVHILEHDANFIATCDPATVAALCRDARRYVWLRDNATPPTLASIAWGHSIAACEFSYSDDAIDAALRDAGLLE